MPGPLPISQTTKAAAGGLITGAAIVGAAWYAFARQPVPAPPAPLDLTLTPDQAAPTQQEAEPSNTAPASEEADATDPEASSSSSQPTQQQGTPASIGDAPSTYLPEPEPTSPITAIDLPEQGPPPQTADDSDDTAEQSPADSAVVLIAINSASADELQLLPGVGPVRAQAIIDERDQSGPFRSEKDLTRVSGIGEKTAAKIAPLVRFDLP